MREDVATLHAIEMLDDALHGKKDGACLSAFKMCAGGRLKKKNTSHSNRTEHPTASNDSGGNIWPLTYAEAFIKSEARKGLLLEGAPRGLSNGQLCSTTIGDDQTRLLASGPSLIVRLNVSEVLLESPSICLEP